VTSVKQHQRRMFYFPHSVRTTREISKLLKWVQR